MTIYKHNIKQPFVSKVLTTEACCTYTQSKQNKYDTSQKHISLRTQHNAQQHTQEQTAYNIQHENT